MNTGFLRMKAVLAQKQPELVKQFRPPASRDQIAKAEQALGLAFPGGLVQMYLAHDGCGEELHIFLPFNRWCSLEEMIAKWEFKKEIAESLAASGDFQEAPPEDELAGARVMPVSWSPGWIPVGVSNTATTVFVDLSPAPRGMIGQLIVDGGMGEGVVDASSLDEYFCRIARLMTQGLIFQQGIWCLVADGEAVLDWYNLARQLNRPDLLEGWETP
jgi:cell wall assembly regulator SMI1